MSPKSTALPMVAISTLSIVLETDGVKPPANIALPLPPRCSVGPAGIIIQPVELFVLTPAITGPLMPVLSVMLLILNCDIMIFIQGPH